jgi:O-antigen biosynthesis protein
VVSFREAVKQKVPRFARQFVVNARRALSAPPLEDIVLHEYQAIRDYSREPRLSLVLPSIAPEYVFGGVSTGLEIFLTLGLRTGAELRLIIDEFERGLDRTHLDARARVLGLNPDDIEVVTRDEEVPRIDVRQADIFVAFNWWTMLNVRRLASAQTELFGGPPQPIIYLIQEYEPHFYPFSTTHMSARLAFEPRWPCWGVFNSRLLYDYFCAQGHAVERAFVFEPRIEDRLRPFLEGPPPTKTRRILVYGRPTVPRNCFPAIVAALTLWAKNHPEFQDWEVVSAGAPHPALSLGDGRVMRSLGKLDLQDYAALLRTTAIGLSLMSSPHPSYPPLEMAHFGLFTVTNKYANKDLAAAHDCIISAADVSAETLADALAAACARFEAAPNSGWAASSRIPSFLRDESYEFVDDLVQAMIERVWRGSGVDGSPPR